MKDKTTFSPAQLGYMVAKAHHLTTLKQVRACRDKELAANVYVNEETGERITSYKSEYMMSSPDFESYLKRLQPRYAALGMDTDHWDSSPHYKAQLALEEAEVSLLTWGLEVVKTDPRYSTHADDLARLFTKANNNIVVRDKLIDTIMRLDHTTIPKEVTS